MTANQIVSFNLRRARELRRRTQQDCAERLTALVGERWSTESYAQAERAAAGKRVRRFDADELHAFSRVFGLPIAFFLVPPPATAGGGPHEPIHHAHARPQQGEMPVEFFRRVVSLDDLLDPEHQWVAEYLDSIHDSVQPRFREALNKRERRAAQDAIADEIAGLAGWIEPLRRLGGPNGLADQLETVKEVAETQAISEERR
jgi:transcriptional regulator with XRE-family HTH domain